MTHWTSVCIKTLHGVLSCHQRKREEGGGGQIEGAPRHPTSALHDDHGYKACIPCGQKWRRLSWYSPGLITIIYYYYYYSPWLAPH